MAHFKNASTGSTYPFDKPLYVGEEHPERMQRVRQLFARDGMTETVACHLTSSYYRSSGTTVQRKLKKRRQKKKQRFFDKKLARQCILDE